MKNSTTIIICLSIALLVNAQESNHNHILSTPNWGSEFFDFPIRFAKEIPYKGYEEAVFPKGWAKEDSHEFWSYAFAWKIETIKALTTKDFETHLQHYFDGLMDIKNQKNDTSILATKASITANSSNSHAPTFYGSIYFYEGRYTKKMMTLFVMAEISYRKEENKSIVLFKFSPKFYNHKIWQILNSIKISDKASK
ncbi:hypothetical protein [uncultured Croceitalea sp.]|uniref:hypothetical protein n=1 Tax=uncultured Croceitalea sp. TaxID=1798908 RepID=UPI0033066698